MIRSLCSFAIASGFYSGAALANLPKNNTAPMARTITEMSEKPNPNQLQQPSEKERCATIPLLSFDKEALVNINKFLGDFKDWVQSTNRYHEHFSEDFFGERELTEEEEGVYNSYEFIFDWEDRYLPGTPEGEAYLRSDSARAFDIIADYAEHANAQKYMLDHDAEHIDQFTDKEDKIRIAVLRETFATKFSEPMMDLFVFAQQAAKTGEEISQDACGVASPAPEGP